jgi:anti-anti-sigma factor
MAVKTSEIERHGRAALLRVRAERLTEIESPSLLTGASNAIEAAAQSLLLDMGEVRFMASAGIGALLELRKLATGAGGKLVVFNLSDELLEVLKLTNLDRIFVIAKDEAKALKSVA